MINSQALEAAENLTNAYNANTRTLNKILWRNKILMTIVTMQFVIAGALGLGYKKLNDSNTKAENAVVAACVSGNLVREGLLKVADKLEEFGRLDPNGQTQQSKDFIVELRTDFALRKCEV